LSAIFRGPFARLTLVLTLMNACTLFAWWGFNLWLPSYLKAPPAQGGIGLGGAAMSAFVVIMQIGMWFGYVTFGFISDALGRKRTYVAYLLAAAALLFVYVSVRVPSVLLFLGPCVAFFATGYFSGFGAVTAEIYPTAIRASGVGTAVAFGRAGAILVGYAGPWALEYRGSESFFWLMAAALVVTSLSLATVRRHVPAR
jgi:MFS family permease